MLVAIRSLGESFEDRDFRKRWPIPPLLLPKQSKLLNQLICVAMGDQEMPDCCLLLRRSGKGARKVSIRTLEIETAHWKTLVVSEGEWKTDYLPREMI